MAALWNEEGLQHALLHEGEDVGVGGGVDELAQLERVQPVQVDDGDSDLVCAILTAG